MYNTYSIRLWPFVFHYGIHLSESNGLFHAQLLSNHVHINFLRQSGNGYIIECYGLMLSLMGNALTGWPHDKFSSNMIQLIDQVNKLTYMNRNIVYLN